MSDGDPNPGHILYEDRWIRCTPKGIVVRGYYFPWGAKRIPYTSVHALERVELSKARGNLRIWGTANPHYWASYDPDRPRKRVGFSLDLGRRVLPFLTPEDPDAFEAVVREHSALGPGGPVGRAPIV